MDPLDFSGRVVLVVGGYSGIAHATGCRADVGCVEHRVAATDSAKES